MLSGGNFAKTSSKLFTLKFLDSIKEINIIKCNMFDSQTTITSSAMGRVLLFKMNEPSECDQAVMTL